jgi:4-amino-4-deoxy-L-arabinose transferase-like glycosyltransferase
MRRSANCAASVTSEVTAGRAVEPGPRAYSRTLRWALPAAAVALSLVLNLHRLGDRPLAGDEAIYANPARAAAEEGHWYPLQSQRTAVYHSKPPLMIWPVAASFALLGTNETAARLPSALSGAALVGVVAAIAGWLLDPWSGLLAAVLLAANPRWLGQHGPREGVGEPLLTLLLTLAFVSFFLYRRTGRRRWFLAALLPVMASSLIKGVFGPVSIGVILLLWEVSRRWWTRRQAPVRHGQRENSSSPNPSASWPHLMTAPLVLIVVGSLPYVLWLLDLEARGVSVRKYLHFEVAQRLSTGIVETHVHGPGFYPHHLWIGFGWWWVALVPAILGIWRWQARSSARRDAFVLVALAGIAGVAGLYLSASTLPWYLYPAFPALSILLAAGCAILFEWLAPSPLSPVAVVVVVTVAALWRLGFAWEITKQIPPPTVIEQFVAQAHLAPGAPIVIDPPALAKLSDSSYFYLGALPGVRNGMVLAGDSDRCTYVITDRPADVSAGRQIVVPPLAFKELELLSLVVLCDRRSPVRSPVPAGS